MPDLYDSSKRQVTARECVQSNGPNSWTVKRQVGAGAKCGGKCGKCGRKCGKCCKKIVGGS